MKSIGIYTGTFDPIHEGHVSFSKAALSTCKLDVIYFIPERTPRNKNPVSELSERILTMHTVLDCDPMLDITSLESNRFSVNKTLPEIETRLGPAIFTLLVGSDVAKGLESWPQCEVLLSKWNIAIGMRNNDKPEDIEPVIEQIESKYKISVRRSYVHTDKSKFSSTQFRKYS